MRNNPAAQLAMKLLVGLAPPLLPAQTPVASQDSPVLPVPLQFSAGFINFAVLQRGDRGTAIYGFATTASPVKLTVAGDA